MADFSGKLEKVGGVTAEETRVTPSPASVEVAAASAAAEVPDLGETGEAEVPPAASTLLEPSPPPPPPARPAWVKSLKLDPAVWASDLREGIGATKVHAQFEAEVQRHYDEDARHRRVTRNRGEEETPEFEAYRKSAKEHTEGVLAFRELVKASKPFQGDTFIAGLESAATVELPDNLHELDDKLREAVESKNLGLFAAALEKLSKDPVVAHSFLDYLNHLTNSASRAEAGEILSYIGMIVAGHPRVAEALQVSLPEPGSGGWIIENPLTTYFESKKT